MLPIQEGTQQLAAFPITTRCSLSNLPQDVIHYILLHLGVESTRDCSLACKHLYVIIQDQENGIWKKLYLRDFACYRKQNNDSFRQAYQSCHSYELNLKKGRFTCRTIAHLNPNKNQFSYEFFMSNKRLYIEHLDNTIIVLDLETDQACVFRDEERYCLRGNNMGIYKNQLLLLKSNQECEFYLDIYDLDTKNHLESIKIDLEIDSFAFCDNKLILSTLSREIWIWNIDTQAFSDPIAEPSDSDTYCMAVSKGKLFLGAEGKILVLDVETRSFLNPLAMGEDNCKITRLTASENELIALSEDGLITIWDIGEAKCLRSLIDQRFRNIGCLIIDHAKFFAAFSDGALEIWKISTGECLNTLQKHVSDQLYVMDKKIFSGSYSDRKVEVYDFS
jgi:WD40 repeat protein